MQGTGRIFTARPRDILFQMISQGDVFCKQVNAVQTVGRAALGLLWHHDRAAWCKNGMLY